MDESELFTPVVRTIDRSAEADKIEQELQKIISEYNIPETKAFEISQLRELLQMKRVEMQMAEASADCFMSDSFTYMKIPHNIAESHASIIDLQNKIEDIIEKLSNQPGVTAQKTKSQDSSLGFRGSKAFIKNLGLN